MKNEMNSELYGIYSFKAYKGDIVRDAEGNILNEMVYASPEVHNLVVNNGKNLALDRLFGLGSAANITNVGVGTDSTAVSVSQTQLNPSVAGSVLLQVADAGTARVSQVVTIASTYGTAVANFTWNELALFNGAANGFSLMFNRVIVGPFAKTSAVSIIVSVQVTQS